MGFNYEQYKSVLSKNTTDSSSLENWSNATGDVADLQSKLSNLEANLAYYRERENLFQADYDRFNAMSPCNLCKKEKEKKEAGKKEYASKLGIVRSNISNIENAISTTKNDLTNEINRVYQAEQKRLTEEAIERKRLADIEQKRLDDAAQKVISDAKIAKEKIEAEAAIELAKKTAQDLADKEKKALDIKREIDLKLVDKGVVPEAELKKAELAGQAVVEAAKINATAQAKVTELTGISKVSNKKYFIIGGFLVAIIGAYLFFSKTSNN